MSQLKPEYKSMSKKKKRQCFHKMSVKQSSYVFGEFFALNVPCSELLTPDRPTYAYWLCVINFRARRRGYSQLNNKFSVYVTANKVKERMDL
jgi:hypothetical protein